MFVILLKFADKSKAKEHMQGHNAWIDEGVASKGFLVVGGLQPNLGGAIIAAGSDRTQIEAFIAQDPFVKFGVVSAELLEISPTRISETLKDIAL